MRANAWIKSTSFDAFLVGPFGIIQTLVKILVTSAESSG